MSLEVTCIKNLSFEQFIYFVGFCMIINLKLFNFNNKHLKFLLNSSVYGSTDS